jgi:hypothetical protein
LILIQESYGLRVSEGRLVVLGLLMCVLWIVFCSQPLAFGFYFPPLVFSFFLFFLFFALF